ncbi:hypothetical protein [Saccharibacillus alkalitolerans]|uniref:B12-binding domain-containing protein n=1 Tax=Saccharibacillus alkalitolerans TaxID=2705290 RepID=A0ABX0F264_9BACL|nr:hypothetical protein [Saccharibacillus alkalitolerans]NGZ74642.1 hypothetical protein [Saccharibacillus alkalitolerans]
MRHIRAVLLAESHLERPEWIAHRIEETDFVALGPQSGEREVELFAAALLNNDGIEDRSTPQKAFEALLELDPDDGIAVGGGIAFYENDVRRAVPGCCGGIEQIPEIVLDVRGKRSPWMGHDPWPTVTYEDDRAYVWPDNAQAQFAKEGGAPEPNGQQPPEPPIVYPYDELLRGVEQAAAELKGFIDGPLHRWLAAKVPNLADAVNERLTFELLERIT